MTYNVLKTMSSTSIFSADFRKGLNGLEEENRRLSLLDNTDGEDFVQEETDWEQDAVVDEDQL